MTDAAQQHTLDELFERAIQIEHQSASIYRQLAERFAHHPESVPLWQAMAADEDMHARVLARVRDGAAPDKLASPAPAEAWLSVTEILRRLNRDPLESIVTLHDAYELAHEHEHSEVNAIFQFLAVDVVPGQVEGNFVRTHIAQHQQRLTDFRQAYTGPDWRQVTTR